MNNRWLSFHLYMYTNPSLSPYFLNIALSSFWWDQLQSIFGLCKCCYNWAIQYNFLSFLLVFFFLISLFIYCQFIIKPFPQLSTERRFETHHLVGDLCQHIVSQPGVPVFHAWILCRLNSMFPVFCSFESLGGKTLQTLHVWNCSKIIDTVWLLIPS